jgi:hypothetical protein
MSFCINCVGISGFITLAAAIRGQHPTSHAVMGAKLPVLLLLVLSMHSAEARVVFGLQAGRRLQQSVNDPAGLPAAGPLQLQLQANFQLGQAGGTATAGNMTQDLQAANQRVLLAVFGVRHASSRPAVYTPLASSTVFIMFWCSDAFWLQAASPTVMQSAPSSANPLQLSYTLAFPPGTNASWVNTWAALWAKNAWGLFPADVKDMYQLQVNGRRRLVSGPCRWGCATAGSTTQHSYLLDFYPTPQGMEASVAAPLPSSPVDPSSDGGNSTGAGGFNMSLAITVQFVNADAFATGTLPTNASASAGALVEGVGALWNITLGLLNRLFGVSGLCGAKAGSRIRMGFPYNIVAQSQ